MLKETVRKSFNERFHTTGAVYAAPGRVNLIGEHTDYNLGFVLPGAIDKAIILEVKPNGTESFNVRSIDYNEETSFVANGQKTPYAWANYILGVIMELKALGFTTPGFDCVFGGNIPLGGGLSSSAALESAFAFAINDMNGFGLSRMQLAKVGQLAEHNYAGVRCGIMDQFASLHGQKDMLMKLDCRSLDYELVPFKLDGYRVILLDTNVKHSLASSEYNVRRAQCEEGIATIIKRHPKVESLRDVTLEMLAEVKAELSPVVYNRCEYVVKENIRLNAACEALKKGDILSFGKEMYGSHEGLSKYYEVSCKELDFLVDVAKSVSGVIGARMMGGGFGGCTINVVAEANHDEFVAAAVAQFEKQFGKKPTVYDVVISDGARKIS
ncbi:galactokinase [uncultured Acetobacteroides sp.]|uniref:galactokinase n=1 Tax=uncultured Acetobacteroides sp. TaxID=1760811 RepID=UPI0029F476FB|nr:galactokinase [uncultured Acetobacteroides sp.]